STCWPSSKLTRTTVSVTLAVSVTDSLARAVPSASMVSIHGWLTTLSVTTLTGAGPAPRAGPSVSPPQAPSRPAHTSIVAGIPNDRFTVAPCRASREAGSGTLPGPAAGSHHECQRPA